jgi:hypothetical protein
LPREVLMKEAEKHGRDGPEAPMVSSRPIS